MVESTFLEAFKGKNTRVPVWFMRQAGRYLPQYRALKKTRTLNEMFRDPDTACEITLQPIDILGVDAAILFADILTLPSGLGFKIDFIDGKGPVIDNPITSREDINRLGKWYHLEYVGETIKQINVELPQHIPLIGFAGSPYTVLTYLCPKHGRLMHEDPTAFHLAMQRLTDATVEYLQLQQDAGIKAFQLFDTWAGQLREEDYKVFVLPYIQQIFKSIKLPSIYYLKNCAHLLSYMDKSGADVLSVCETVTLGQNEILNKTSKGIQGNLFNGLLYAPDNVLVSEATKILLAAKKHHSKYIFNLSHGIFPDVDPSKLALLIKTIRQFNWKS